MAVKLVSWHGQLDASLLCTGVKVSMICVRISTLALPGTEFDPLSHLYPRQEEISHLLDYQGRNHIIIM